MMTTRGLTILLARLTARSRNRIFRLCHYFAIEQYNDMAGMKSVSGELKMGNRWIGTVLGRVMSSSNLSRLRNEATTLQNRKEFQWEKRGKKKPKLTPPANQTVPCRRSPDQPPSKPAMKGTRP